MKRLTESQIQIAFFDYVRLRQDESLNNPWNMIYSTPNQRTNNNFGQINRFKKEGMSNGFPDISILVPRYAESLNKWFHGYFIELKRKGGKPSEAQLLWQKRLRAMGYACQIIITDDPEYLINDVKMYFKEEIK